MKKPRSLNNILQNRYTMMMSRCYNKKSTKYRHYGKRGIKVALEWIKDINVFRAWAINQLRKQKIDLIDFVNNSSYWHLDRIDVNGHYTPKNCRFATQQENQRNKRNSKLKKIISAEGIVVDLSSTDYNSDI